MQLLQPLRQRWVHERANDRLRKLAVNGKIGLRHPRGRRETPLIRRIVAAERADVIQRSRLTAHEPLSGCKLGVRGVLALALEYRLVEPGRQRIDQVDITGKLVVLFFGDAAGNEDAKMANGLVDRID